MRPAAEAPGLLRFPLPSRSAPCLPHLSVGSVALPDHGSRRAPSVSTCACSGSDEDHTLPTLHVTALPATAFSRSGRWPRSSPSRPPAGADHALRSWTCLIKQHHFANLAHLTHPEPCVRSHADSVRRCAIRIQLRMWKACRPPRPPVPPPACPAGRQSRRRYRH